MHNTRPTNLSKLLCHSIFHTKYCYCYSFEQEYYDNLAKKKKYFKNNLRVGLQYNL